MLTDETWKTMVDSLALDAKERMLASRIAWEREERLLQLLGQQINKPAAPVEQMGSLSWVTPRVGQRVRINALDERVQLTSPFVLGGIYVVDGLSVILPLGSSGQTQEFVYSVNLREGSSLQAVPITNVEPA